MIDPSIEGASGSQAAPAEPVFDPAQESPYFADDVRAGAVRELLDGHAANALKRLPKAPTDLPTRFIRAQALAASGDDAGAAREFESLAGSWPALGARCHCLAAASFETIGDLNRAVDHWRECAADPPHARSAPLAAARLLERENKRAEALAVLAPLKEITGYGRAEALLLTAQIQAANGQSAAALVTYRQLVVEEPSSGAAEQARVSLRALAARLKAPPLSDGQTLERIDRLVTLKQTARAQRELQALHAKPICSGTSCQPKRCHPADEEEETDTEDADSADSPAEVDEPVAGDDVPPALLPARRAHPFTVAQAHDDEDKPDALPEMPACVVPTPTKPANALSCKAQLLKGLLDSHSKGLRKRALESLRVVYASCADPEVRSRAAFAAAGAAARLGDNDAFDLALIAGLQFPKSPLADDALLAAADLARKSGDSHSERLILHQLVRAYPESELRADALFRLFWSHRADGRPDRGLEYLDVLSRDYENGPRGDGGDAERGRYWWGRTVSTDAVKQDRSQGVEVLTTLARERATTYYGLLARSFLASLDSRNVVSPLTVKPYDAPLRLGLLVNDHAFPAAVELWRMGETSDARELFLATNFKALRADGVRGQESTLIVAEMLERLGDARSAHSLARRELLRIVRDGRDPLGRRAALVCYPLAFRRFVSAHATQAGFAPDFLQGLMREESALDPRARSPVGARGLTQLMPATARLVARSLGLRRYNVEALWQPDTNITIGSVYLGRMLKLFGHPGLAAAAYNAGPNAVSRWLTKATGAFDEFVEQIPFDETRGYVKRVLRSYAAYSYLYEPPAEAALHVSLLLPNLVESPR